MVEIVLHIGGEKTGTTSIQTSLKSSRARLAEQGVLFPRTLGDSNHVAAYVYASDGAVDELKAQLAVTDAARLAAFRGEIRQGLRAEIAAMPGLRALVVSNEHLSSRLRDPAELTLLRGLFDEVVGPARLRIVYFARPQWELIPSLYSTYVKTGGVSTLSYPLSDALHHKLQHLRIVELWRAAFPDAVLDVRPFSTTDETFDAIDAFSGVLGMEGALDAVPEQNISLSATAIELMRVFNKYVPRSLDHKFNPARGNIQQLLEAQVGPALEIPVELQGLIAQEFADDNARLNELCGREVVAPRPDLIERARAAGDAVGRDVPIHLDTEEAVRLLGECFAAKQTQFLQVKERVTKLQGQVQDLRGANQRLGGGAGRGPGQPPARAQA